VRSEGRLYLAQIHLYQGKFDQALQLLEQGIAADRFERVEGWPLVEKYVVRADIYVERKNLKLALEELKKGTLILRQAGPKDINYSRDYYATLLAENGQIAEAEEVAQTLKKDIEKKDAAQMKSYWLAAGGIERAKRNLPASIAPFEKAARGTADFSEHYWLARAYLEAGRLGEAVSEFEKILPRYDEDRSFVLIWAVKIYYQLGLAYEKSGWNNKAIEKYQEFLDIWKNADPGIPEVEDAKQRLANLKRKA
jgi:Tfp pilus assembly protein PilF